MNDFAPIDRLCRDLLLRIAAPERSRLLRHLGREIRRSQSERIAAQRDPDGAAFAPRRPKADRGRGKPRLRERKMFRKLRAAKYLKASGTAAEVSIGFTGRAARIARPHQDGGLDAPAPGQAKVRYARRVLLGLTDAERARALDLILAHIAPR